MSEPLTITLKTLTPLWTGGADGTSDRLHETGLLGSLRWWYEALVRGIGRYACDPTSDDRCPDKDEKHCAACEVFGCTGWARKFRLQVLNPDGDLISDALKGDQNITFKFIPLRGIVEEEKWLLTKTVEMAAMYGALGGKTTLKPQAKQRVGADYGIVTVETTPLLTATRVSVVPYLRAARFFKAATTLPDLRWFFFVKGGFLWRPQINSLLGLSENGRSVIGHAEYQEFLRGRRGDQNTDAVSKAIFSFRAEGGRVWGYARNRNMRDIILKEIRAQLPDAKMVTGEEVLNEL